MSSRESTAAQILLEAVEHEPGTRPAFVQRACAGDPILLKRVEALLKAHGQPNPLLDGERLVAILDQPITEKLGTLIGPYKLRELLGDGGMGSVYVAEQETPVRRKVALKIIKPGMDSRQVLVRFEAERQTLALMDHPNIARVLDAGTTDGGLPYFVMELVRGILITEFCDQRRLVPRQRLELFIQVCRAIQHAHQKGIIHRDIKPSNILVTLHDDLAVPKVIDFGIAKATSQQFTDPTVYTAFNQMIGTPLYMSPEQAEMNALDVDTRSDVYSLGVLLYELLTGSTPTDNETLRQAGFDEMRRLIREVDPPCPSQRVSTLGAHAASTVSQRRGVDERHLRRALQGELDWIIMKALEKDRNRRYESASALAADVQRHLDDKPVRACPPSATYRLQKFSRRNRSLLLTLGLVAVALVLGSVASVSQAVRATKAEMLAKAGLDAESRAHREANEARAGAEANSQKARRAVDEMYTQVAEKWLSHQPQMEPLQREFLEKSLRFYAEFAKESSNEPAVRLETARAYRRMADIQHRLGQSPPAEIAFERAIDHLQALADEFPATPTYRAELAATLHKLGVLLGDTGRYHDEEKIHRRALVIEEQLAVDFPATTSYRCDLGRSHWYVGRVLSSLHRKQEAEISYRSGLAIQKALVTEFPSIPEYREHLAQSYLGLGNVLRNMNRFEEHRPALAEAATILEQLAAEFPSLPEYRNELADAYFWLGRTPCPPAESEHYLRQALTLQRKLADDFPAVADYRYDLVRSLKIMAQLLSRTSRPAEAEAAFREATASADKLVTESPSVYYYQRRLALTYIDLGEFLTEYGRHREAEDAYRRSIALFEKLVAESRNAPEYGAELRDAYHRLGSLLIVAGQPEQAAEANRKASAADHRTTAAPLGIAEQQSATLNEASQEKIPGTVNPTPTSLPITDN